MCNNDYCIRLKEVPLLTCRICGQGSHNACVLSKYRISPDEESSFTPEDALKRLNPDGIGRVRYLCGACDDGFENIPKKTPQANSGLDQDLLTPSQLLRVSNDNVWTDIDSDQHVTGDGNNADNPRNGVSFQVPLTQPATADGNDADNEAD